MSHQHPGQSAVIPAIPPTEPFAIRAAPRTTTWPMVLGVVSIVLGIVTLFNSLMAIASPAIIGWVRTIVPSAQLKSLEAMDNWTSWISTAGIVGVISSALLIAAASAVAARRRLGARLLLAWAIFSIPWGIVSLVVNAMMQGEQFRAQLAQQQGTGAAAPPLPPGFTDVMLTGGIILGAIWTLTLPIFIVAWLSRRTVRTEINGWPRRRTRSA